MKKILIFILFSCASFSSWAQSYEDKFYDLEEPTYNKHQKKAFRKTRKALLKIDAIEERANYFVFKLKNLTFGEYSDNIVYLAPIMTGKLEFSVHKFNFYFDHLDNNKGGVKYSLKF